MVSPLMKLAFADVSDASLDLNLNIIVVRLPIFPKKQVPVGHQGSTVKSLPSLL